MSWNLGKDHTAQDIESGQDCHGFTAADGFWAVQAPGKADGFTRADGKAWHGLGRYTADAQTPEEALRLAGLDWLAIETGGVSGVAEINGTPVRVTTDTHKLLIRSDTGAVLGCVGAGYSAVQNHELPSIARALADEAAGEVTAESAGSIHAGRRVFMLLRGEAFDVRKGDTVYPYLLLANGHDGSLAFTATPTSVRVVCKNTLNMAIGKGKRSGAGVWIKHTGDTQAKIRQAREALARFKAATDDFRQQADALARRDMTREEIQAFWVDVLQRLELGGEIPRHPRTDKERKTRDQAADILAQWARNFDAERATAGATAWNAANAATRWYDHQRHYRGKDNGARAETRLNTTLLGEVAGTKVEVFRSALALV